MTSDTGDAPTLTEIMDGLAEHDPAMVWALYTHYRAPMRSAVRREIRRQGGSLPTDEADQVVLDVCMALLGKKGWDPEGRPPWVWARRTIVRLVAEVVGQHGAELGDAHLDREADRGGSAVHYDDDVDTVLARLADHHPRVRVLQQRLHEAVTERDRRIFLWYAQQQAQGDPSPSHTIAAAFGLRPAAVRKVVERVRRRVDDRATSAA